MRRELSFFDSGEMGLLVRFKEAIHPSINREVMGLFLLLERESFKGIIEITPAYNSLLIEYDPLLITYEDLVSSIKSLYHSMEKTDIPIPSLYMIPTCYGGEFGPDLSWLANYCGLTPKEVIALHSGTDYLIYMLGFSPGFPYLGGMDERLAVPRLREPRSKIPAGSVAIASQQTGIYPSPTPGGWRIIGRTPLRLFTREKRDPVLLKAGNYLRFLPIEVREYEEIYQRIRRGTYRVEIRKLKGGDSP